MTRHEAITATKNCTCGKLMILSVDDGITNKFDPRDRVLKEDNHPMAKLHSSDVINIIELLKKGTKPYKIAEEYKVTNELIYAIQKCRIWKSIPR